MSIKIYISFLILLTISACHYRRTKAGMQGDMAGIQVLSIATENNYNSSIHLPEHFGFGKKAPASLIKRLDISISPDGKGLPDGKGTPNKGELIYKTKCAMCHGATGIEGPYDHLVASDTSKVKAIGNYWPYATTIFDYIRRAMPFNKPGSLTNEEVYNLTAYLLYRNKIINKDKIIDAVSLPQIGMPAKHLFVNDDRKGGPEIR